MGNQIIPSIRDNLSDCPPDRTQPPTFDPLLGFPNGRKERVMVATQEEMSSAKVPLQFRDYCAHFYIDWLKCREPRLHNPFLLLGACKHEDHLHKDCLYQDTVLRMKEYERERRLKLREKRIQAKKLIEDIEH